MAILRFHINALPTPYIPMLYGTLSTTRSVFVPTVNYTNKLFGQILTMGTLQVMIKNRLNLIELKSLNLDTDRYGNISISHYTHLDCICKN